MTQAGLEPKTRPASQEVWFLDAQVRVDQPASGYKAGTDSIFLAMAITVKADDHILDMGTGSGVLPCLINFRYPDVRLTGIDNNPAALDLARHNTAQLQNVRIENADVAALPKTWNQSFDQVISNPPFFDDLSSVRMSDEKQSAFVSDAVSLHDWVLAMNLMLKPRGLGSIICRADRIDTIIGALYRRAGRIRILPIHSYSDAPANRVIIQFRKGAKSPSQVLPGLIMHDRNGDTRYSALAQAVLAGQRPLNMA